MPEQDVCEAARRGPDIEAEPAPRTGHPLRRKCRQGAFQLQRSPRGIVIARVQQDHIAWLDTLSRS